MVDVREEVSTHTYTHMLTTPPAGQEGRLLRHERVLQAAGQQGYRALCAPHAVLHCPPHGGQQRHRQDVRHYLCPGVYVCSSNCWLMQIKHSNT